MSQTVAYKLRQFTEPISRHVTSTVQQLIKGQPRTGLNRHRRGYAIKEAASGVHSQDVGSYWARPVSIFKLPSYHHHSHLYSFHHIVSIINFNPILASVRSTRLLPVL